MSGGALIAVMCIGQLGNLLPHVTLSANLAQHLMPAWGLSAAEGGLMASGYAFGYMLAVPVLTTLTDRIDARIVLLWGSIVSGLATMAFGIFAQGFWSGTLIWSLAGLGFAGAYMPGLKALTDRLPAGDTSRAVTLYTSSFSVGVGLSFLVAQVLADRWGWRTAFYVTGVGPIAMVVACLLIEGRRPVPKTGRLLNFAPVFANREALGYILGYGAHCFELYGIRTWLVGFWTFVVAHQGGPSWMTPVLMSFCFAVISMPASILGNEAALKFGRHRAITVVMIASASVALVIGLNATAPAWVLALLLMLYGLTVPADSGALTAGMSAAAISEHRGATLALHSTAGFGLSAAGAWGTGVALDMAGGPQSASGWLLVFIVLAAGIALGPLALLWSRRDLAGKQPS
ncbi:putative MFS family arabinose efflux permease [Bradyrhizobium ottawaense]|uniref:MFS family arabinose efflux permease n=2 Tax=Nitrobacteraceae TaxID=41294 RepID=A0ABV4G037_9BRAD|nr:MFS transporter [Bradyrhizobium ottawaense]GMO16889.1 MFS transporter [Bradyrhizobium ottawaense]GMO23137.1 MFS transporter [Bradyrhizobium ottawaense]GMO38664.1 MFS transporter [Bradyrhizobium ottawaense]GMO57541.1 MFS transporter [Bradyrhizobium ottawaense]